MRTTGVGMVGLAAILWLGSGGCQRSIVSSPEPPWSTGRRAPETARGPQVPDFKLPANSLPPLGSNAWKPSTTPRVWRHIVIHHTASESGSVETIHAAHLARKDKNGNPWLGIGYHFLIGNGQGMGDGVIEPTFRWRQQIQGAHAGDDEYNQHGIGICLVGNFEKQRPSSAQMAAVKRLVTTLKAEYRIPSSHIVGHREVKATACPGKMFPLSEIAQADDLPFFGQAENSLPRAGGAITTTSVRVTATAGRPLE